MPDASSGPGTLAPQAARLRQRLLAAGSGQAPAVVMGIVNVTPDSFSDGGHFHKPKAALAQADRLVREGAEVLDLGAESTRPGAIAVTAEEEWARLEPVLERIELQMASGPHHNAPFLSIDTTKARVAEAALSPRFPAPMALINDVWGFQHDHRMASVVAAHGVMAVLMHNRPHLSSEQGQALPDRPGVLWESFERFFDLSLARAHQAGVVDEALLLDPGIGFGKTLAQNLEALALIPRLRRHYGLPVMVGASRKSLFARLLERPLPDMAERLPPTLAAHLHAAAGGACLLRVHDVQAHVDALAVQQALQLHRDSRETTERTEKRDV
ncbi:dihydropteroate synthase [Oecophyllibacter saccharovorans]|uniref:Dihydropteroate synthase n=1 Tax=Oecophyllibacter saccharovorans TaxID=2558360 RepID=A0A506UKH1_9PROT|nr:dihydropteroate synthase [Oecophyllibacter saccharovorans]TPW33851.1 dihydropteroate synthase [Oecophyllibacter saccharovorans]